MASKLQTMVVEIKTNDRGAVVGFKKVSDASMRFQKSMEEAKKSLGGMSRSLSSIKKILGAGLGFIAVTRAISAFAGTISDAMAAAAKQAEAEQKLSDVLKATGGAAGLTKEEMIAYAGALQKTTTFGDEAIINAQAILATFKNIREDAFKRTTQVALDMATVMGTDLNSAMVLLGKAINDPVSNLGALTRVGVQFTNEQKEMIKSLWEAGDQMGSQNIILKELESEFGGAASGAVNTFSGAQKQLANIVGDLKEKLGLLAGEGLRPLVSVMAEVVSEWDGAAKQFVSSKDAVNNLKLTVLEFAQGVVNAFVPVGDAIVGLRIAWNVLQNAFVAATAVMIKAVQGFIGGILSVAKYIPGLKDHVSGLQYAYDSLTMQLGVLKEQYDQNRNDMKSAITWSDKLHSASDKLAAKIEKAKQHLKDGMNPALADFKRRAEEAAPKVEIISQKVRSFGAASEATKGKVKSLADQVIADARRMSDAAATQFDNMSQEWDIKLTGMKETSRSIWDDIAADTRLKTEGIGENFGGMESALASATTDMAIDFKGFWADLESDSVQAKDQFALDMDTYKAKTQTTTGNMKINFHDALSGSDGFLGVASNVFPELGSKFKSLFTDVVEGKLTSLKDFWKSLWGDLKSIFIKSIADMLENSLVKNFFSGGFLSGLLGKIPVVGNLFKGLGGSIATTTGAATGLSGALGGTGILGTLGGLAAKIPGVSSVLGALGISIGGAATAAASFGAGAGAAATGVLSLSGATTAATSGIASTSGAVAALGGSLSGVLAPALIAAAPLAIGFFKVFGHSKPSTWDVLRKTALASLSLSDALGTLGSTMAGQKTGLSEYAASTESIFMLMNGLPNAINAAAGSMSESLRPAFQGLATDSQALSMDFLNLTSRLGTDEGALGNVLPSLSEHTSNFKSRLDELISATAGATGAEGVWHEQLVALRGQLDTNLSRMVAHSSGIDNLIKKTKGLTGAGGKLHEELVTLKQKLDDGKLSTDDFKSAVKLATQDVKDHWAEIQTSITKYNDLGGEGGAIPTANDTLNQIKKTFGLTTGAVGEFDSALGGSGALIDHVGEMTSATGSLNDELGGGSWKLLDLLNKDKTAAGAMKGAVGDLSGAIGGNTKTVSGLNREMGTDSGKLIDVLGKGKNAFIAMKSTLKKVKPEMESAKNKAYDLSRAIGSLHDRDIWIRTHYQTYHEEVSGHHTGYNVPAFAKHHEGYNAPAWVPRHHDGYFPSTGEHLAVIRNDETVLTPQQVSNIERKLNAENVTNIAIKIVTESGQVLLNKVIDNIKTRSANREVVIYSPGVAALEG